MSKDKTQGLVFKALANEIRREILDELRDAPRTTGELCDRLSNLDRCTVMQHLSVLEKARLIIVRREGKLRWNHLNVAPLKQIYDRWISRYAANSVELLMKLKRELEK
jgi:DNA-binding transcriptional ArsR family regulator